MQKSYLNSLMIRQDFKGIPYPPSNFREDGSKNFGFKNLKSKDANEEEIPELEDNSDLKYLINSINSPSSGLFSIGCLSSPVEENSKFRHTGYVEFCINSRNFISDATNYFPLFFHFDKALHEGDFSEEIKFDWVLMMASFFEKNIDGFTCSIYINTNWNDSASGAKTQWGIAAVFIANYLKSWDSNFDDSIY